MSLDYIFLAALYYVFVQFVLLYNLQGGWRLAAFIPIPAISICMCLGVLTSVLGPVLSTLLMSLALPFGTLYLIALAILWTVFERSRWLAQRKILAP